VLILEHSLCEGQANNPARVAPDARVGHSSATIGKTIYVFGGRGGPSMSALDEHGAIWVFSTTSLTWSLLEPAQGSPTPEPRSYHTMTATPFPAPISTPNITNVLLNETPDPTKDLASTPAENTYGTIFLHAGCLSSGGRTSDLWSFDIASRTWAQLPSAPDPARGGTSLTMIRDRLYRFGGFNGKTEEGGQIDYLDLNLLDQFSDEGGEGLMAVSPRGEWSSIPMTGGSAGDGTEHARTGPTNRSVAGFVPVSTGAERDYLLMICGEGQASTAGHAAAGKFLDDIWSFKPKFDTSSSMAGRQSAQGTFKEVEYHVTGSSSSAISGKQEKPLGRRGWFAASEYDEEHVVVWGGIGEDNERLGDGWLITVG